MEAILVIVLLIPLLQCQTPDDEPPLPPDYYDEPPLPPDYYDEPPLPSCPPLIGDPSPPGCNLTFVRDVDGEFPCETSDDCPMGYGWWDEQPGGGQCVNPTTDGRRTYAACNEKK